MMTAMNIQRDAKVMAADGEIGHVTHVVVAPTTKEVTDIVVDGDGGERMIPMSQVQSVDGERVTLRGTRAQLQEMAFRRDEYHEVDEDELRAESTRTAERGGAPLRDADEDEVEVGGRREPRAMAEGQRRQVADGPARLQLREERLRVGKEIERAGEVELHKRVVERTETADVPLRDERVVIERHPVNERIEGGEITETDETIDVDVMRERAVAEKETVVTEEVGVRKEAVERTQQVQGTVRKEELVVEGDEQFVQSTGAAPTPGREQRRG